MKEGDSRNRTKKPWLPPLSRQGKFETFLPNSSFEPTFESIRALASLDSLKAWPKQKENGAIKSALAQIRSFWTRTIGVSLQLNQSDPYLEDEKAVTLLYIVIVQPRFSFNGILGPRNALTSPFVMPSSYSVPIERDSAGPLPSGSLWFFPAGLVALRSITINSIRYLVHNKEEMEDLLVISYAVVRPSQAFSINRYSCQIHFPSPRSLSFELS